MMENMLNAKKKLMVNLAEYLIVPLTTIVRGRHILPTKIEEYICQIVTDEIGKRMKEEKWWIIKLCVL